MTAPGPIPRDALQYFRAKVPTPEFDWRDIYREEHAHAFTVAKAMQLDVLNSIGEALDRNLAEGQTYRQFAKNLTPELQRLGWWGKAVMEDPLTGEPVKVQLGSPRRLKTIYRANMRTARAAGQWQRAQRTKKALPYLIYELGPSREHRAEHVAWHGTVLAVDDPWWNTHMPPNGWGCKCGVRQVTRREYERLKKTGVPAPDRKQVINPDTGLPTGALEEKTIPVKTKAPEVRRTAWENKRTGQVEMVPEGIDPGWDTNPGQVRQKNLEALLAGKLDAAPPSLLHAATADLVASGRFGTWVDRVIARGRPAGEVQIVGAIDREVAGFVEGKGVRLQSSVIDINDKGILHSQRSAKTKRAANLDLESLRRLPEHLLSAERYWDDQNPALLYVFDTGVESKLGKAVVRVNYAVKGERTNRVVTTGYILPSNLGDPRYEKIPEK